MEFRYFLLLGVISVLISQTCPHERAARAKRQLKFGKIWRIPGLIGLGFRLLQETRNDTKSAITQISDEFSKTIVQNLPQQVPNGTFVITQSEVLRILGRNLRGLRNLYNLEKEIALYNSSRNVAAFRKEVKQSLVPFFQPQNVSSDTR